MGDVDLIKAASCSLKVLADAGLSVEQSHDFEGANRRILGVGKPGISPPMSAELNDFTERNAFWFFLKDGAGDVAGVSARFDDLGGETVATWWPRTFGRYYPIEGCQTVHDQAGPAVQMLTGRLIYMGDLFFADKARGRRDVLIEFVRLLHITAAIKWRFDWIYAFMRERDVMLGFSARYGFSRIIPNAQVWADPPPGRASSEFVCAMSRVDLQHSLSLRAVQFDRN